MTLAMISKLYILHFIQLAHFLAHAVEESDLSAGFGVVMTIDKHINRHAVSPSKTSFSTEPCGRESAALAQKETKKTLHV